MATTDANLDFVESSPPGLFPDNDDSDFGIVIRVPFTDRIQDLIGQQDTIYNERFVSTSTEFLDEWETETGTPTNPSGLTTAQRQSLVLSRIRKGPFTRALRDSVISEFVALAESPGTPVSLTPSGVALTSAGLGLYSGISGLDTSTLFSVVEDIPNFAYHVYIIDTITVDIPSLTRELDRITPAHLTYDITSVSSLPREIIPSNIDATSTMSGAITIV